jgi:stearoyl-CoA desaturase (delta-9 desaturase)
VERWQLDSSARIIRWFERLGWAYDVRWPSRSRIDSRRNTDGGGSRRRRTPVKAA